MSQKLSEAQTERTYLSWDELVERMRSIKAIATDVDGVLTDDTIYVGPDDLELKRFNVSDGFYMSLANRAGLELIVISGRPSEATTSRMRELGVKHLLQAPVNKAKLIKPTLDKLKIEFTDVAFVGNEILDLPLLRVVGLPIGVLDSSPATLREVDYVTSTPGGRGALREVLEAYFEAHNLNPEELLKERYVDKP